MKTIFKLIFVAGLIVLWSDNITEIGKIFKSTIYPTAQTSTPFKQPLLPQETPKKQSQTEENIYSWIDEKGIRNFSNVDHPKDDKTLQVTRTIIRNSVINRETPVTIQNNSVLIPVKFSQNGITISALMLLDTGCSGTLVHPPIVRQLQPNLLSNGKGSTADGRTIDTTIIQFDYIEVGPFKENNFIASTSYVQNAKQLNHQGLLGMAFLKKHPFQIDHNRQVIKWL